MTDIMMPVILIQLFSVEEVCPEEGGDDANSADACGVGVHLGDSVFCWWV